MTPPAEFNEKGVVWALVCSIGDVCADVRVAAQSSLCTLGAQQPTPVLRALLHTCMQQPSPAPGVVGTLMNISQQVLIDCAGGIKKSQSVEGSDDVFDDGSKDMLDTKNSTVTTTSVSPAKSPLDSHVLDDWLAEAVHQLTRTSATNTVRVSADNLLVVIASHHAYFSQVCDALLAVLSSSSVKNIAWQSALETVGNVCSCDPTQAVTKLPVLLQAMQDGADKANSDQVRSIIAATVAKLSHTVAEVVAEKDNKLQNTFRDHSHPASPPEYLLHENQPAVHDSVIETLSESIVEPVPSHVTEPMDEDAVERDILEGNLFVEMSLEQELNQAEMTEGRRAGDSVLLSACLPDSPPSSRQEGRRPDVAENDSAAASDSTPEDGLTLDFNIDDLPHDPHTVSDTSNDTTHMKEEAVSLSSYTAQCDAIVDVLVNQWLKTNNSDLRNETIAAIGHISALLSREKLEIVTPVVITAVIGLYKKISLPYNLTCTLAQLLAAVVHQEVHECFKPQLDSLIGSVLSQASMAPCYNEPNSVRNHSEALRCCHLLATAYPAQLGAQLLSRLENASHVQRVAALVVTRHLVGCRVLSEDIISATVRLLAAILHDSNTRVIRAVAQLVLELCHHGHLDHTSAPPLITYLVRHSAGAGVGLLCNGTGGGGGGMGSVSGLMGEETVGDTCSRALYLLTTTVPCAHPLLWPRLLLFLVNPEYESSLPTVLPCIAFLVNRPHHSPDVLSLLPLLPSLPQLVTPQHLVTRLLSLCADPSSHPPLGGCSLAVLAGLGGHLNANLRGGEWREQGEQLRRTCVSLAATEQDSTALQIWQDTVREFLGLTLSVMANEDFTNGLISAMVTEITGECESERRLFLLGSLGAVLRRSSDARLITDTLNTALRLTNHRNPVEQVALGVCVGGCGATHTELVLGLLAAWLREADHKKMINFMAMLKSDSGEASACLRRGVVICLGQVCALAPHATLSQHVHGPVMLHLLNVINTNKHPGVGAAVVDCISLVCRALTGVPGGASLQQRPLLIAHLVHCCDDTPPGLLPPVLQALRDLLLLDPPLEVEERTILLQAALNSTHAVLTAPASATPAPAVSSSSSSRRPSTLSHTASSTLRSLASGSALSTPRHSLSSLTTASLHSFGSLGSRATKTDVSPVIAGSEVEDAGPVEVDALTGDAGKAFAQLNLLLRTVIQRDPTPAPLDDITTLLHAWLLHPSTTVRSAAITLLLHTLHTYHTHLHFPPQVAVNFHQTSQVVGALVPRLGDPCGGVRCGAVGCVVAVLRVAARYNAHPPQQIEEALQPLTDVQKEIGSSSGDLHEDLLRRVAQVLCRELSGVQLRGLVFAAAGGLQDRQAGGRGAVAVVLAEVLRQRGHTLHYCCKQLLDHVYGRLERVSDFHTRSVLVEGLTHLASPHLPLLADTLLGYPIPPHRGVCETWQAIGRDPALVCAALTHLQRVLERSHAHTPQRTHTGHTVRVAAIQPLAALLCLTQLLQNLQATPLPPEPVPEPSSDLTTPTAGVGGDTGGSSPSSFTTTATLGRAGERSEGTSPQPPLAVHPHAEAREAVLPLIPELLAALLPRYGSYVGVLPPLHHTPAPSDNGEDAPHTKPMSSFVPNPGATGIVPARALLECLGHVWGVVGCPTLRECLLQEARDVAHTHTLDTLTHTMASTATLLVSSAPQQLAPLVTALSGPHSERGERAALAALYSQLVREGCRGDTAVLSAVTASLLMLAQDHCPDVRRLALRGLAHYAHLHKNKCYFPPWFGVDDRLHEIVGALVGGTDQREETLASLDADTDPPPLNEGSTAPTIISSGGSRTGGVALGPEERVCVEALRGLSALLPQLPAETVLPHAPLLLIRARLFAEKSSGEVREASFGVVRGLSTVVGDTQEFQEHMPQHLLAAVLHLADAHPPTVVLCKSALLSLSHHVSSEGLQLLLQARLSPSTSLDYRSFLAALAPLLVAWLGEQLSLVMAAACSYYHSRQPELRAAAAHFTGEVVRWSEGEGAAGVATGLVHLMKDPEPPVRTAAATAAHLLSLHTHLL